MTYTMTKNEQFGSIEILFDGKPSDAIRDALKALKFRWHGVRRIWYGYTDEQTARTAMRRRFLFPTTVLTFAIPTQ